MPVYIFIIIIFAVLILGAWLSESPWSPYEKIDHTNWGYSSPVCRRFKAGSVCLVTSLRYERDEPVEIGDEVVVVENGRHDYLVRCNVKDKSYQVILQQDELKLKRLS